jgi:hypothetical protein
MVVTEGCGVTSALENRLKKRRSFSSEAAVGHRDLE